MKNKIKLVLVFLFLSIFISIIGLIFLYNTNQVLLNSNLKLSGKIINIHFEKALESLFKKIEELKIKTDEEKLEDFYNKLTLKQKIGQLFIVGHTGAKFDERAVNLIKNRNIGGFCLYKKNAESKEQLYGLITMMQNMALLEVENGIPLFIAGDNEPGKRWMSMSHIIDSVPLASTIPSNYTIEEAGEIFEKLAKNLKYIGYNIDFAPVVDVNTNPDNPIIANRSFSDDPDIVSDYSVEFIHRFKKVGMITTAKHFPGHGDTNADSHKTIPIISHDIDRLNKIELLPFQKAIQNQVDMIMTAHVKYETLDSDYPATLSKKIISDLLRGELNFKGIIISDDMYMRAILDSYDQKEAIVMAINSGVDIILITQIYKTLNSNEELYDAVLNAVKDGTITEERLRSSVIRVLKLKCENTILKNLWGKNSPIDF